MTKLALRGPWTARRVIRYAVLCFVLALLALVAFDVTSGRYQVRPVLSGSMEPGLPTGAVVVTQRVPISSLHVWDVIVFHRPDNPAALVVHRIISMRTTAAGVVIETRGDNNPVRDPWQVTLRGSTAYRAEYSLPFVGYVAVWMHNPVGRRLLLEFGAAILIIVGMCTVWSRHRQTEGRHRPEATEAGDDDADFDDGADDACIDAASDVALDLDGVSAGV